GKRYRSRDPMGRRSIEQQTKETTWLQVTESTVFSQQTTCCTTDLNSSNIVSGNTSTGISTAANTTRIEGNIIGLDSSMKKPMGNGGDGIYAVFLTDALIGPIDSAGAWNIVSGNRGNGIVLGSATLRNVRVTHNVIGSNWKVDTALANGKNGILVRYDASNVDIEDNDIVSNWGDGIRIERNVVIFLDPRPPIYQRPHNIRITANAIGLAANKDSVLFHGGNGIAILNADSIYIERNIIAGCLKNGIEIGNDSTRMVYVRNNQIGGLPTDPLLWGNQRSGVYVYGANDVTIGDEIDGKKGNHIGNNYWYGVQLAYDAQMVKILGNQMCTNAFGGIVLDTFDQYYYKHSNDAYDNDVGSNQLQNTPQMWIGALKDGKLRVAGFLDGKPNTSYRIDVGLDEVIPDSLWYSITMCDYVSWFDVRTDPDGLCFFDTLLVVPNLAARFAKTPVVTTTATGTDGTSQFSLKPLAPPDQLAIDIAVDIDTSRTKVYDNGRAELTATITNRGFDLATVVTIHDTLGLHFSADSMGISKGVINFFDSVVVATIPTIAPGEKITMRVVGRSLLTGKYVRRVVAFPVQRDLIISNNQDTITLNVSVVNSVDENGAFGPSISYRPNGSIVIKGHGGGTLTPFFYDLLGRPVESAVQRMMVSASEELVLFPPQGSKAIVLRSERKDVGRWVLP
ncbi:MAG: right-handed parallel beta-helix repeat-containing protein, partial [Candidatus Kapabacteria bacterium]|nr:right-handed parallel beta-helix repeat-containing protein [Candidatus Kapabacteria bacterium]